MGKRGINGLSLKKRHEMVVEIYNDIILMKHALENMSDIISEVMNLFEISLQNKKEVKNPENKIISINDYRYS